MKKIYLVTSKLGYKAFNSYNSALRFKKEVLETECKIIELELLGMKDF